MIPMLIDTHAHLDFPDFANDLEDVLRRAEEVEVRRVITIGTSIESSRRAIEIAASDDAERVITLGDERTTVGIVLAQLVHHANEHRAHATTILGANGRPTPKIGAWSYGLAKDISNIDGD